MYGAVEIFGIFLDRVAALFLGAVQRDIGVLQNLIGIDAVIGEGGYADRSANLKAFVEDFERFGTDHLGDFVGNIAGVVDIGRERHRDGEFVLSRAGDDGAFGKGRTQSLADTAQDRIAHIVAHRIVDVFEMVEIERDNGKALGAALVVVVGGARLLGQDLDEVVPVGKARQLVEESGLVDFVFGGVFNAADIVGILLDECLRQHDRAADLVLTIKGVFLDVGIFRIFRCRQKIVAHEQHRLQQPARERDHQNDRHESGHQKHDGQRLLDKGE